MFKKRSKRSRKSVIFLAIATALLLITHNLTVMMICPVLAGWIIIRLFNLKKKVDINKVVKNLLVAAILGLMLASFYVVPLILERNLVHLETLTQGYFNYLAHFATLAQLFFSFTWGYGPSILGPNDDTSLSAGPIHFALVVLAAIFLLRKMKKDKSVYMFLLTVFFGAVFLSHQRSTFIWQALPFLSYLQFPWRFLIVASFSSALLGGFIIEKLGANKKLFISTALIILVIFVYARFFVPKDWFYLTDQEKLSGVNYQKQITASIYDYLPKSAKKAPNVIAPDTLINESGEVDIIRSARGSNWYEYEIEVFDGSASLVIPTYDFPGWQVKIDERKADYERAGDLGLLAISVPKGRHNVYAKLTKSSPRQLGDLLTLFGIVGVLILICPSYFKNPSL